MRAIDRRVRDVERIRPREITAEDILRCPAWWELRGTIVEALRPFPEAKEAVVEALHRLSMDGDEPPAGRRR